MCSFPRFIDRGGSARGQGFTLVEMLTALAVLSILSVLLLTITDSATGMFTQGQGQIENRLQSRAMLDYMGRDLRLAALALNQSAQVVAGKPTLQLLINPNSLPDYQFPQSIFWQAPIATDDHSLGDMAEIGYFIRWGADNHADLCRYFVNPTTGVTDTPNPEYLIYNPNYVGNWLSEGSKTGTGGVDTVAPITPATTTSAGNYQGLFLENVLGLWVQAYDINGKLLNTSLNSTYDSSANSPHPLPAYVVLSIVVLNSSSASHLAVHPSAVATIQQLYAKTTDAPSFFTALTATGSGVPLTVTRGASLSSIKVSLDNYR